MTNKIENRFFFHANAVALGARIRRPDNAFVPSVASACLPVIGGVGSGESAGGRLDDVLSYGKAATKVFGDFVAPERAVEFTYGNYGDNLLPTETVAEASLEALEVRNGGHTVSIEFMLAAQSSFSNRRRPTQFRSLTADFRNVRVDDATLLIKTHTELFDQHSTKQQLAHAYAHDQDFRTRHAHLFRSGKRVNPRSRALPAYRGLIYTTVVTSLEWEGNPPSGATIDGNRLTIDNFGSVYFGELIIEEEFRRLTLVRFQLGSPTGGAVSGPEVQSNGSTWPPQHHSA